MMICAAEEGRHGVPAVEMGLHFRVVRGDLIEKVGGKIVDSEAGRRAGGAKALRRECCGNSMEFRAAGVGERRVR